MCFWRGKLSLCSVCLFFVKEIKQSQICIHNKSTKLNSKRIDKTLHTIALIINKDQAIQNQITRKQEQKLTFNSLTISLSYISFFFLCLSISLSTADDTEAAHAESVKFLTTDVMKSLNSSANDDYYRTSQSNLESTTSRRGASEPVDEMSHDLTDLARDAPLDGGESTFAGGNYSNLGASGRSPSPGTALSADSAELSSQNAAELAASQRQLVDALGQDNAERVVDRPLKQLG